MADNRHPENLCEMLENIIHRNKFAHLKTISIDLHKTLISWEAINNLLWQGLLMPPRIDLFRCGKRIPANIYMQFKENHASERFLRISRQKLYSQLNLGATLIINSVDELIPNLEQHVKLLELKFKTKVRVNAYISFTNTQGFDAHWDNHDVFIMQISGKKNWRIYKDNDPISIYKKFTPNEGQPNEVSWNEVINEGDGMFIPRGIWHDANALDEPSIHLTFGFQNLTALDYIQWLLKQISTNDHSILEIPLNMEKNDEERIYIQMHELLKQALATYSLEEFLLAGRSNILERTKYSLPNIK